MTETTSLAAQLEALAEKATPGPWKTDEDPTQNGDHETLVTTTEKSGFGGTWIAGTMHNWQEAVAGERRISWKEAETNAALIVALRNNLPAIIATLCADQRCAELEAENARLREALAKDATRFEVCAGMIEQSFNASGTLRAERTMKAKHFALEALTALENRDD